uniref:SP37.4 n=1 Tax=Bemisia tabaci TaxID=7038 RepID=A0A7S5HGU7_BEMTA|nr:SP37.4 [Bemisia tabaci]
MTLIGNLLVACLLVLGAVFCDSGATAPPEHETACTKHCHEEDGYIKDDSGERQWISAPDVAHQDTKSTCHCKPSPKLLKVLTKMKNIARFVTPLNKQTVRAIRDALRQNGIKIEGSKATKHGGLETLEQPSSKHGRKREHVSKFILGDEPHKLDLNKQPWVKKYVPLSRLRDIAKEENCNEKCRQKDGYVEIKKDEGKHPSLKREYEQVYIMVGHVEDSDEGRKCVCKLNDALLTQLMNKSMGLDKKFKNAYAQGALYGHVFLANHDFKVRGLKGSTAEEQQITDEKTLHLSPNESKEAAATAQRKLTASPRQTTHHF